MMTLVRRMQRKRKVSRVPMPAPRRRRADEDVGGSGGDDDDSCDVDDNGAEGDKGDMTDE